MGSLSLYRRLGRTSAGGLHILERLVQVRYAIPPVLASSVVFRMVNRRPAGQSVAGGCRLQGTGRSSVAHRSSTAVIYRWSMDTSFHVSLRSLLLTLTFILSAYKSISSAPLHQYHQHPIPSLPSLHAPLQHWSRIGIHCIWFTLISCS